MARDSKGRFQKGESGNSKGRPPKERRCPVSTRQMRRDVLLSMEEEMGLTTDGRRQRLPIILFIYKQLLRKAANGDVRCMFKVIELRTQLINEILEDRLSLLETLTEKEKLCAEYPEDVPDSLLWLIAEGHKRIVDDEP